MVEVTPGSFAPSPSAVNPPTAVTPPPGIDPTSRTERATRSANEASESKNQPQRTVEDRVEARNIDADAQRRQMDEKAARTHADNAEVVDDSREQAARDRHEVDLRI